jgi:SPP1 gp7 family putative phage head morphogenesis protein
MPLAQDLNPRKAWADWAKARRAETQYGVQLRKIARHIGEIIRSFNVRDPQDADLLAIALRRYSDIVALWAPSAAASMIAEVEARQKKQWRKIGAEMGRSFSETFAGPDIGARYRQLMDEQVGLITSLPREAAERVHHLVTQGVVEGKRFTEIIPEIERGGEVSSSRATLIARTETGRVVTNLTQARAESAGSVGYIWRTVKDAQVRPSHRAMEGQFVRWDSPPILDGLTGHAGALPNCRCFCEPVIPMPGERFRAEAA